MIVGTTIKRDRARPWSIGTLSRHSGVKVETIRFYEKAGLLAAPRRSEGGHRQYDQAALQRLVFVRRARELGFPTDDIRTLLHLVDRRSVTCSEVREIAHRNLAAVRARLADLARLEEALAATVEGCSGEAVPDCPVIEALAGGDGMTGGGRPAAAERETP